VSDAQQTQATNHSTGLGAMLRHAREAAGLSQAELARQLNLGARIVEAMEQEDLQTLPGAVYVHGYLRKWAEYLQLDEQQLLQAYTRMAGELRNNNMRHTTPIEPMRMKKPGSNFPWYKLLFFIGIVGLGLFATRFLPESMRLIVTAQETPANTVPNAQSSTPVLPSIPLLPPPEAKPTVPPVATTPGIVVGESLTPANTVQAVQAPITPTTPSAAPSLPGLELKGLGNAQGSWVRVKDADARVIFEGILAPGNSKQLDGKRPFEITIGRASELGVTLDGTNVDLKPYARSADKAFIPKLGSAPSP
jgi:cytoskeleton protein RodZ